jgi:hypothetical protein
LDLKKNHKYNGFLGEKITKIWSQFAIFFIHGSFKYVAQKHEDVQFFSFNWCMVFIYICNEWEC